MKPSSRYSLIVAGNSRVVNWKIRSMERCAGARGPKLPRQEKRLLRGNPPWGASRRTSHSRLGRPVPPCVVVRRHELQDQIPSPAREGPLTSVQS
ncbi:unnamed protein product [Ascophyllum nodosum]